MFEALAAFQMLELNHSAGEGTPERLRGASVSTNYFQVLGVAPELGATFQPLPEDAGPQQVVVISPTSCGSGTSVGMRASLRPER